MKYFILYRDLQTDDQYLIEYVVIKTVNEISQYVAIIIEA